MDSIAEASLLYDFYGGLLTERQRQVMALYHEENLSLSEIAEEFHISRQAVHDTLKKAEQTLSAYEETLGLVRKFLETDEALAEVEGGIAEATRLAEKAADAPVVAALTQILPLVRQMRT